jgi:protocatechuate 3,4-dioxygenase beta subunit
LAKPARVVSGTVREKGSGKLLAGFRVNGQAVTDAKGHYELHGVAKAESYRLFAAPTQGELYFSGGTQVTDKAGLGPLTADIDIVPGIPCRGRVTDKATGKPVRGYVGYVPIWGNPNAADVTRHGYHGEHLRALSEAPVSPDGSFTCCVLPGPGALVFRTPREGYRSACVNPKTVFKDLQFPGDERLLVIDQGGGGGPLPQDQFQAIALIDPAKDVAEIAQDLTVEVALWVTGTVLGPDGKPRAGLRVVGLPEGSAKTDQFKIRGINPGAPRRLYFYHDAERLVGTALVKGDETEPLTVRLQPWGTVTGRLVTEDNQPLGPVQLFANNPGANRIGIPGHFVTDRDGNFRIEGLVPRVKFSVFFTKSPPGDAAAAAGYLFQQLSLKPGETRDLGTTKGRAFPGS